MRGQCRFPGSAIAVPQSITRTPNRYGRGPPSSAPRGSPREGRRSGQPSHRNTWQLLLPHEQVDGRKRYAGMQVKHFTPHAHTYVPTPTATKNRPEACCAQSAPTPMKIGVAALCRRQEASSRCGRWRRAWRRWKAPCDAHCAAQGTRRQAASPPRWLNARRPGKELNKRE